MTCSKNFGRLLQVGCLGLIGMLTVVGCGGSESKPAPTDGGQSEAGVTPPSAALNVTPSNGVNLGSIDLGSTGTATVIVTNTGTAASGALTVVGSAGITTTGCTGALAAHANCTMIITAAPTAIGGINGTVSVSANPGAITPLLISITGTVVQGGVFNVSPATIDLGSVLVGAPATKQTITVSALVALSDLAVAVNGADITKDATSTCTAAVAVGTPCTVVVSFVAASNGARSNSVVISAKGVTKTVPITANAQNPAKLVISPSSPQALVATVGQPSAPVVFGVSNSGDLPAGPLTVAITGTNKADFAATPSAGCTLIAPLGTACTITVVFTPAAVSATAESATLTLTDTGTGASTVSVALSGTAYAASLLTISPAASDLGSVLVGATGTVTTFTVTNTGGTASGALTVAISTAEIVNANDTCSGTSLAPAGTCTIGLELKPTSGGAKNGTLSVVGADGKAALKPLTGTATLPALPAALAATPTALDFSSVRINNVGTAQTVTVKNTGGAATGALTFTKVGQFGLFPISNNTCSAALPPAGTCSFAVNFAPTEVGSQTATYTVTDGTASATVAVSGNALDQTGIVVTQNPILACPPPTGSLSCFMDTVIAGSYSQTVTVKADSPLPAGAADTGAITAALVGPNAADFVITQNQCTAALLANATCTITVAFVPTAVGPRQATLSVTTANGGSDNVTLQANGLPITKVYACTGTGAAPACPSAGVSTTLSTTAADFDFGQVSLNATAGVTKNFRVIVRGPTAAVAPFPSNTITVALNDPSTTGANFSYPTSGSTNPCTGAALTVSGTNPPVVGAWTYNGAYQGYYCDFAVKFLPQGTVKEVKTATVTASGSATNGGTDTETLTGTATGPLTITLDPRSPSFPTSVVVGDSTNDDSTHSVILTFTTAPAATITTNTNLTLDVNNTSTTVTLTTLAVALTGDQFEIVWDGCSNAPLAPHTTCNLIVAFSPTGAPGAKTGTVTVTGGGETATYSLTGNGGQNLVTLLPAGTIAAPVDIAGAPVVEGAVSAWKMFTIANPTGAPKTNQISWQLNGANPDHFAVDGTQGTTTPCGASGVTSLNGGQSCNIWVQYKPQSNDSLTATVIAKTANLAVYVNGQELDSAISGTPANKLAVTSAQATKTVIDGVTGLNVTAYDFGDAAVGADSALVTLTVANLSPAALTVLQTPPVVDPTDPFSIVTGGTCVVTAGTFPLAAAGAAGASCTVVLKMTGRSDSGLTLPLQQPAVNVTFSDNASGSASTVTAKLTGRTVRKANLQVVGLPTTATPVVAVDLGSVANPNQTAPVTLSFINTGDVAATSLSFMWSNVTGDVACVASADGKNCDPFTVLAETTGVSCLGLSSLAPQGVCKLSIVANPVSSTAQGVKTLHFTLSATGGIAVSTVFKLQTTVRRADTTATEVYFDYGTTSYGFLPFVAATSGRTAPGTSSTQSIVTIENKTGALITFPLQTGSTTAVDWASVVVLPGTTTATSEFTVAPAGSNPCGLTVATSCTLGVTFTPSAASYSATSVFRFASLNVTNVLSGPPVVNVVNTLGLVGEVKSPASLTFTPAALDFDEVLINSSATLTAVVTNVGQTDSAALTQTLSNTTVYSASGCAGPVVAGGTCTLTVIAVPAAITNHATLSLTGAASPLSLDVAGVVASSLAITTTDGAPATLVAGSDANSKLYDYGAAANKILTVGSASTLVANFTITNSATQTSGPLVIALAGNTDSYTLNKTNCMADATTGVKLGPSPDSASCTVTVTFKPATHTGTTVPGDVTTTLSVTATPGAATAKTVAITGHSKSALDFFATPASTTALASPQAVLASGGLTLYVKKSTLGASDLLSTAGISGGDAASFYVTQNTCLFNPLPSAIEANGACTISVQYIGGTTTTAKSTTLTVSDGTTGNTNAITLKFTP